MKKIEFIKSILNNEFLLVESENDLDEYNAPRKLYMMTFNHGCGKNKRIANFGESDAAQKFFSRV